MEFVRARLGESEAGQSIVLFAVLVGVMMSVMGLAVEGGRVMTDYRRLQAAADMAALVGAQDLPCTTSNASCITTAETDACTYAGNNGFSGCTAGGASTPSANVPPVSCSPYDFIDYGNDSTNSNCKSGSTPQQYYYIEVRLTQTPVTIPIFNVSFNMYAHAVARRNVPTPGDYTLVTLSTTPGAETMSGTNSTEIGGSSFSNGSVTVGGVAGSEVSCDGGWYTAATESAPSGLQSNTSGTSDFSPSTCSGGTLGSPNWQSGLPQVTDPYGADSAPPLSTAYGYYYTWSTSSGRSSGSWAQASSVTPVLMSNNHSYELFPGTYAGITISNGAIVYFNPGIYTMTGSVSITGGSICIYGAPACSEGVDNGVSLGIHTVNSGVNCSTASFLSSSTSYVNPNNWYYYCSPYGYWDSSSLPGRPGSLPAEPYFYDNSAGSTSSVPLNGVTFYIQSGTVAVSGNGSTQFLPAPNPCPGTGSQPASTQISWNQGDSSGSYTYPTGSLPQSDSTTPPSSPSAIYPSADFTVAGECLNNLEAWSGEFTQPQHLEFLFWSRNAASTYSISGGGQQNLFGIVYNPDSSLTLSGNAGGTGMFPWLTGQAVGNTTNISGSHGTSIGYRECGAGSEPCVSGLGTSLVE